MVARGHRAGLQFASVRGAALKVSARRSSTGAAALVDTRISEREQRPRSLPAGASQRRPKRLNARKDAYFPAHVRACLNSDLPGPVWGVTVWAKSAPGQQTRIPYTCGSYRCTSPECQRHAAHCDFARIKEAVETELLDPAGWCFVVLTLDRRGTYSGKPWSNEQDAFRELSDLTRHFMRNFRRWQEDRGWESTGNEWVMVVESHAKGWPHANLMVYSPELAAELRRDYETLRDLGCSHREATLSRGHQWDERSAEKLREARRLELRGEALAASKLRGSLSLAEIVTRPRMRKGEELPGWGIESTAEACDNRERLAGYIVKLGAGHDATAGELAKMCQAPTNARMKLRRIRAGRGFLPPRKKNPEWTGVMLKRMRSGDGSFDVDFAHDPHKVRITLTGAEVAGLEARAASPRLSEADAGLLRNELVSEMQARRRDGIGLGTIADELEEIEARVLDPCETDRERLASLLVAQLLAQRRTDYLEAAHLAARNEVALSLSDEREALERAKRRGGLVDIRQTPVPVRFDGERRIVERAPEWGEVARETLHEKRDGAPPSSG